MVQRRGLRKHKTTPQWITELRTVAEAIRKDRGFGQFEERDGWKYFADRLDDLADHLTDWTIEELIKAGVK